MHAKWREVVLCQIALSTARGTSEAVSLVTRPSVVLSTLLGATFHRTGEKFSPLIKRPLNKVARKKLPRPLISEWASGDQLPNKHPSQADRPLSLACSLMELFSRCSLRVQEKAKACVFLRFPPRRLAGPKFLGSLDDTALFSKLRVGIQRCCSWFTIWFPDMCKLPKLK